VSSAACRRCGCASQRPRPHAAAVAAEDITSPSRHRLGILPLQEHGPAEEGQDVWVEAQGELVLETGDLSTFVPDVCYCTPFSLKVGCICPWQTRSHCVPPLAPPQVNALHQNPGPSYAVGCSTLGVAAVHNVGLMSDLALSRTVVL